MPNLASLSSGFSYAAKTYPTVVDSYRIYGLLQALVRVY